jgi:putative SOS response-associated peptidase YedK
MCYRFSNTDELVNDILKERLEEEQKQDAYFYHASPFEKALRPVITQKYPDKVSFIQWAPKNANARSEKIFDTWPFKLSINDKRCIIPATGFYEHRHILEGKKDIAYPYHVSVKYADVKKAFFIAGVCGIWDSIPSFAMLTTDANEMLRYIHNGGQHPFRMPVILSTEEALQWLKPTLTKADIEKMYATPYPADGMIAHSVNNDFSKKGGIANRKETLAPYDYQHAEVKPVLIHV